MNGTNGKFQPADRKLQQGATLITVMIIMVIITMLGLTAMRMGLSSLALASNSQASNILFQAADVGMMEFALAVDDTPGYAHRKLITASVEKTGFLTDAVAVAVEGVDPATIQEFNYCLTPKRANRLTAGFCDVDETNDYMTGRDTVVVQVTLKPVYNNEILLGSDSASVGPVRSYKFMVYSTAVLPAFGSASKSDINDCLREVNDDGDSFNLNPQDPASVTELENRHAVTSVTDCLTDAGAVFSTTLNQVVYGITDL